MGYRLVKSPSRDSRHHASSADCVHATLEAAKLLCAPFIWCWSDLKLFFPSSLIQRDRISMVHRECVVEPKWKRVPVAALRVRQVYVWDWSREKDLQVELNLKYRLHVSHEHGITAPQNLSNICVAFHKNIFSSHLLRLVALVLIVVLVQTAVLE